MFEQGEEPGKGADSSCRDFPPGGVKTTPDPDLRPLAP